MLQMKHFCPSYSDHEQIILFVFVEMLYVLEDTIILICASKVSL